MHIAEYVMRTDVMATHRPSLAGLDVGKGCIRYRRPEQVDLAVVRAMLADTAVTTGRSAESTARVVFVSVGVRYRTGT